MLLEDSTRNSSVDCLLCRKPIKVAGSAAGEVPAPVGGPSPKVVGGPPAPARAGEAPATTPTTVQQCPHCKTPLRLPPGKVAAVKCPKCAQVFKL